MQAKRYPVKIYHASFNYKKENITSAYITWCQEIKFFVCRLEIKLVMEVADLIDLLSPNITYS